MTIFQQLHATRYLVPLKEGGSLPAVVDTEDDTGQSAGLFVVKFRGAGQGVKALVAELIVGGLAQQLGFQVPQLSVVELSEEFGIAEGDPEIQDILRGSHGANVGLRYLEGAFNFEATTASGVSSDFASRLVWFDALTFQIDRTARNPNLLVWKEESALTSGELAGSTGSAVPNTTSNNTPQKPSIANDPWLIDHGAALYPHHDWPSMTTERAADPFAFSKDHVLIGQATTIIEVDSKLAQHALASIDPVLDALPENLLSHLEEADHDPGRMRQHYKAFLRARLEGQREFAATAHAAHKAQPEPTD